MEIASRVVPVLPFSICCVWAQEFCRRGVHTERDKRMEGRGEGWEEKGLGEKSTLEMEKELRGREGSGERETMPFLLLTDRSHSILEC